MPVTREQLEQEERSSLAPYAQLSSETRGRKYEEAPPEWRTQVCAEANSYVRIHDEAYFLSSDGYLMPMKKDQAPPDLRYFSQPGK